MMFMIIVIIMVDIGVCWFMICVEGDGIWSKFFNNNGLVIIEFVVFIICNYKNRGSVMREFKLIVYLWGYIFLWEFVEK